MLVAIHAAAPERIVDHALTARSRTFQLQSGDIGGFGQAIQGHVHYRGEAARGRSPRGRGETLPLGPSRLVDVGVGIDQPRQQGKPAEVLHGDVCGALRLAGHDRLHRQDAFPVEDHRCIQFALRRDHAA